MLLFKHRRNADGFRVFQKISPSIIDRFAWLRPSYGDWRLDIAKREARLILVEGESDCWALWHHEYPALGIPGSSNSKVLTAEHLVGIDRVFVHREPDAGGETFVEGITARLKELNFKGEALVFSWPDDVKDPSDLHAVDPDSFKVRFNQAMAGAKIVTTSPRRDSGSDDAEQKVPKTSVATRLVELAISAGVQLFHDTDKTPFASIPIEGRLETCPLSNRNFRLWLKRLMYVDAGKSASDASIQEAIGTLGGIAVFDGPMFTVNVRLAAHDGRVLLDLADAEWRAVEIDATGWRIVEQPSVKFRRPRGMMALPEPVRGGRLDELRPFVNAHSDADWKLILAWLVAALYPHGPKPVLNLRGQQGSAKSSLGRVLRSLVDPNKAPLRQPPREPHDLAITASNGWLICMDNLSFISDWLSDALCCLATGGGFATRELYSNDDEAIFDSRRPIILTAIEDVVQRADLLDRSISVELEPIPESRRRTEAELNTAFDLARPRVLGALLDVLVIALRELPQTRLKRLPRLADFATLVTAAESGLGWEAGAFMAVYDANRANANTTLVEDSPLWPPLRMLLTDGDEWLGTAAELLTALTATVTETVSRGREWPKTARGLSGHLRRLAPSLLIAGVRVGFDRDTSRARNRFVRIRAESEGDQSSEPSEPSECQAPQGTGWTLADDETACSDDCPDGTTLSKTSEQDDCGRFGRSDAEVFGTDPDELDPPSGGGIAW